MTMEKVRKYVDITLSFENGKGLEGNNLEMLLDIIEASEAGPHAGVLFRNAMVVLQNSLEMKYGEFELNIPGMSVEIRTEYDD
jgi:hypothetical protein